MSKKDVAHIVLQAKSGNQIAYTQLLHLFWGDVFRFLAAKCRNDYEAEDLTLKTFAKAFDKLELYDIEMSFKNWLLTIANNSYIDFMRSQQNAPEETDIEKESVLKIPDDTLSQEDQIIQEQQLAILLQQIKNLKPHYREIIHLRYFQEYSLKEISQELNEPMSNVKVKLMRARNLLSEMILKERKK